MVEVDAGAIGVMGFAYFECASQAPSSVSCSPLRDPQSPSRPGEADPKLRKYTHYPWKTEK